MLYVGNGHVVKMKIVLLTLEASQIETINALPVDLEKQLTALRSDGIAAVVLWEDYWLGRKPIVQSRLSAMLGISAKIPARLTQARRIDNATTDQFLGYNHLNGVVSSKFRYGLFLPKRYYRVLPPEFAFDASADELLVAVATFSHARIFEQHGEPFRSHELIRFASLLGTNVVGALDKLLNAFIREKQPDDIMTYADLEWSDGRSYQRLGFEERGQMPPRNALVDPTRMQRAGKRTDVRHTPGQEPIEYLTVFNLGSIKYVKTIKSASNEH
ncbi:hypothetical protein GCM10010967_54200 [Dyadobacter beijingensis]|uniref:Uncharacterized protein n=2 Tax=Dyadobacter beijingensis TaxID=365489 RepID=A0ABQ2IKX3_9BACT|nr:hypothetical protein GCM10010967_54200 [Dyadobacter beijingensis]